MILTGAVIMGFLAICLYCSTLFLNQRSSTKAALAADSASCQEASDWSSNHRYDITSTASLPLWGSYRPGIYFGMKTRSPIALSTGILWVGSNTRRNGLRHDTNQDELTQFEWIVHDGKHYGRQTLTDESYKMELSTTFIVKEVSNISDVDSAALILKINQDSSWIQRIEVNSLDDDKEYDRQKSLFFYVGFEGAEHDELEQCTFITDIDFIESTKILLAAEQSEETAPQLFTVLGRSKTSGYFRLVLTATISDYDRAEAKRKGRSESDISISYVGLSSGDVTRSVNELKESHSTLQYIRDNDDNNAFLKNGNLKNSIEDKSNFLVIQVKSDINFTLDAVLYEHLPVEKVEQLKLLAVSEMEKYVKDFPSKNQKNVTESATVSNALITQEIVSRSKIDSWISYYETKFEEKFDAVYKLHLQMNEKKKSSFSALDIEASRRALSSLLGGIGYFYGSPKIGNALPLLPPRVRSPTPAEQKVADDEYQAASLALAQSAAESVRGSPFGLLSATPSRTSFPRGFLWDEGFHLLVISQWDVSLSVAILSHWMSAMYHSTAGDSSQSKSQGKSAACVGGWIPREIILGKASEKRVPDEFVIQRTNIANPPTLMLVIDTLLDRIAKNNRTCTSKIDNETNAFDEKIDGAGNGYCTNDESDLSARQEENAMLLAFLHDAYAPLNDWIQWFLVSQKGPTESNKEIEEDSSSEDFAPHIDPEGSFRWRGRSVSDNKLIANTLASGLDDFPRSPVPSLEEFHVDLFSWIARSVAIMARLESVLEKYYSSSNSLSSGSSNSMNSNRVEEVEVSVDAGGGAPLRVTPRAFDGVYRSTAEYLATRLEPLHWSDKHQAFLDVGYSNDYSVLTTDVVVRCGDPKSRTAVELSIPLGIAKSGQPFCPEPYNQFIGAVPNDSGGVKTKARYASPLPLKIRHIPRIGYVSLFPFLLNVIPVGSNRLKSMLDIIESPDLLWSNHGLRSIAKNDTFYKVSNEPGDEPYWRGPIWVNVNYLALKALKHYGTSTVTVDTFIGAVTDTDSDKKSKKRKRRNEEKYQLETRVKCEKLFTDYEIQRKRSSRLYHELRKNIQNSVLETYADTGHYWEHYEDEQGRGTRGHPFTGWTALIVNIMAEI